MPTNEERREVASKLLGVTVKSNVFTWDARLDNALNVPVSLVGKDREQLMAALHHLSVMIEPEPERTCKKRNHDTDNYYMRCCSCSLCNSGWFEDIYDKPFSYCPHCGAKVIDDGN